jgi:hypothetical protein
MKADERNKPYIWPTWITGLLAGEANCQWAAWFRSHFQFEKRKDTNENMLARWRTEHAEFVRDVAAARQAEGLRVSVEDQNKFTYVGDTAMVGGKPDLVSESDEAVVIDDCKTGKEREKDYWQVVIYGILLPLVRPQFKGKTIVGNVLYRKRQREISHQDFRRSRDHVVQQIQRTAGAVEPKRTPSASECRFCDIADCPERIESERAENRPSELLF